MKDQEIQKDQEVQREPYSPQVTIEEVEKTFVFNNAPTPDQVKLCGHIEMWGKALCVEIASVVPEGKEQTIAINNVLAAVIWCRHAIQRQPTIELVSSDPVPEMRIGTPCSCVGKPGEPGPAGESGPACTCSGSPA
jgi:hypothetical protein